MPAGTSNLGHDAFKILRDTNLMRIQQSDGEKHTTKQYRILRDEMNGRKKAFDESVADYKLSLVKARERKKQIQGDNGDYWRSQMEWKQQRDSKEVQDMQFDPNTMWNVEESTRRKYLQDKKQDQQQQAFKHLTE